MTQTAARIIRRSATAPSNLEAMRTVIRRELLTRLLNRSVVVSTVVLGAFAGLGTGVVGWFLVDRFGITGTLALNTQFLVATAMISALLAALIYSSHSLAAGVVEEKSSRLAEILLTKIGVTPLLTGKLIGVGLVTLGQLMVIGGAALTSFTVVGGWRVLDVELGSNLLWFLAWFLLGFVSFATLSTLLASTVSRHEDLGTALTPLTVFQLVLWVVALYVVPQYLESTWVQVLSLDADAVCPRRGAHHGDGARSADRCRHGAATLPFHHHHLPQYCAANRIAGFHPRAQHLRRNRLTDRPCTPVTI